MLSVAATRDTTIGVFEAVDARIRESRMAF